MDTELVTQITMAVLISALIIVVAYGFIFSPAVEASFDERGTKSDIIILSSSVPEIREEFIDPGYEYTIKVVVQGNYKGEKDAVKIVPFIEYKGSGIKATVLSKGDSFVTEGAFQEQIEAVIKTREAPANFVQADSFSGRLNIGGNVVLADTGVFRIKLDSTPRRLPFVGGCSAIFEISCGADSDSVKIEKCEGANICESEISLCEGTVGIKMHDVECGSGADVTIDAAGGKEPVIKEDVIISFWETGTNPECVDIYSEHRELVAACLGHLRGEYAIDVEEK